MSSRLPWQRGPTAASLTHELRAVHLRCVRRCDEIRDLLFRQPALRGQRGDVRASLCARGCERRGRRLGGTCCGCESRRSRGKPARGAGDLFPSAGELAQDVLALTGRRDSGCRDSSTPRRGSSSRGRSRAARRRPARRARGAAAPRAPARCACCASRRRADDAGSAAPAGATAACTRSDASLACATAQPLVERIETEHCGARLRHDRSILRPQRRLRSATDLRHPPTAPSAPPGRSRRTGIMRRRGVCACPSTGQDRTTVEQQDNPTSCRNEQVSRKVCVTHVDADPNTLLTSLLVTYRPHPVRPSRSRSGGCHS